MFSTKTLCAIVQLLESLPPDKSGLILLKHTSVDPYSLFGHNNITDRYMEMLKSVQDEHAVSLLKDLAQNHDSIRSDAPKKYVFDERFLALSSVLRLDGWKIDGKDLIRTDQAGFDVTEIRDAISEELASSPFDPDGSIRQRLENSEKHFSNAPIDYNASITNARIALETFVRRLAANLASSRGLPPPEDKWGPVLSFLKKTDKLTQKDEETIGAIYTFISDGSHRPLSDEDWAHLARSLALSFLFFLIKKFR